MVKGVWVMSVVMACALFGGPVSAEQYRSKLLINPGQALGESVELSVEELERQFDKIDDQFARSSAGRHLAHHYLQQQQYDKAIAYYLQALESEGLSEILNQQMRQELATVYLLQNQPQQALHTLQQLAPLDKVENSAIALLYAQAWIQQKQYLLASDALDRAVSLNENGDDRFYKQMLALAFKVDRFDLCEWALTQLMALNESEPSYWFQFATVYIKQAQQQKALSILILAKQNGFAYSEQSILLMCDLYAAQKAPVEAAQLLQQSMAQGRLAANGDNLRRLFEYQMQAKEFASALQTLPRAAKATGDVELYFHWAQLLMEQQQWQKMNQVVLQSCDYAITAKTVGRANLLLGISELKLGNRAAAKAAFENASLLGGVNEQAGQWLRFMGESTTGQLKAKSPSGPCRVNSR